MLFRSIPINKHGAQTKEAAVRLDEVFASDCQVLTFPAGLCSRKQNGHIEDTEWKKSFVRNAVKYHRDVVPVFFEGRNSDFFYRLAHIRKRLGIKLNIEMLYLPDEMFRNKHKTFHVYMRAATVPAVASLPAAAPLLANMPGAVAVVGVDGSVHAASPANGAIVTVPVDGQGWAEPVTRPGRLSAGTDVAVTAVGSDTVVLERGKIGRAHV